MQALGHKSDCKPSFSNEKIVTSSLDKVLVYDLNFNLLKTIAIKKEILQTKISKSEIIAVALKDQICLFRDFKEFATIQADNILGLDWKPKSDDELLIYTSTEFIIYNCQKVQTQPASTLASDENAPDENPKQEWNCVFKVDLPYKPVKVEYSPCSRFIAISGNDNIMMIWYKVTSALRNPEHRTGPQVMYDYVFLNHSTPVFNFEWRDEIVPYIPDIAPRACLLTLSCDNIGRLWSSCDTGYGFQNFDLAGVIEPTTSDKLSSIHWLTGSAFNQCIEMYSHVKNFKGMWSLSNPRILKSDY